MTSLSSLAERLRSGALRPADLTRDEVLALCDHVERASEEMREVRGRPLSWLIAAFMLSESAAARDEIDRRFPPEPP